MTTLISLLSTVAPPRCDSHVLNAYPFGLPVHFAPRLSSVSPPCQPVLYPGRYWAESRLVRLLNIISVT
jgi:hypothetical protein